MSDIVPSSSTPLVFTFPETAQVSVPAFSGDPLVSGLEGHVYVVEFGDYGIKVGVTASPEKRLRAHQKSGRDFGRFATRGLITGPHQEARDNERMLITHCRYLVGQPADHRGEYFDLRLEDVREYVTALPFSRGDRTAFEAEEQRKVGAMKALFLAVPHALRGAPTPVFPWAAGLEGGDLAAFLNDLRDALEEASPLEAVDRVVARWYDSCEFDWLHKRLGGTAVAMLPSVPQQRGGTR